MGREMVDTLRRHPLADIVGTAELWTIGLRLAGYNALELEFAMPRDRDLHPDMQDLLDRYFHSRSDVLGGAVVFRGTRVPVKALFDYLRAGKTVAAFLTDFDGVTPEAVEAVLAAAQADVLKHVDAA